MAAAGSPPLLTTLNVEHPEWRPLLVVIEEALRETKRPQWMRFVPTLPPSARDGRPLLDGAVINVAAKPVGRWVRHVLAIAAGAGKEVEPVATAATTGWLDPLRLFEMAVSHDVDGLDELARSHGDDRGVLRGLTPLIAMPMLQACRRASTERAVTGWAHGYCPICGGWPALAELRGLDGQRRLRCASCGGDWRIDWLRCPFCGEGHHETLGSLVSPDRLKRQTIEVCDACRGYVKTITTLSPMAPEDVVLQDLATVVLDVAALAHHYRRPAPRGQDLAVSVVAEPSRLRDLLGLRP
jgi:FdhE protein